MPRASPQWQQPQGPPTIFVVITTAQSMAVEVLPGATSATGDGDQALGGQEILMGAAVTPSPMGMMQQGPLEWDGGMQRGPPMWEWETWGGPRVAGGDTGWAATVALGDMVGAAGVAGSDAAGVPNVAWGDAA